MINLTKNESETARTNHTDNGNRYSKDNDSDSSHNGAKRANNTDILDMNEALNEIPSRVTVL